jgi:EmrB/QacA subfamily drug resistance transporter
VIASTRAEEPCAAQVKRFVLVSTIIGSGMAFIDSAVVGVALPVIGTGLQANLSAMQWVVNAYVLVSAAFTLVGGAAGDRFGRRRVFIAGIVIFTAASVACSAASGATALVVARVVQGIGGALMVPNSLAIIGATFDEHEKGKAIGTWAATTSIAAALGPVLGGWLADVVSWRAIFFINVPFAVFAAISAWRWVPESHEYLSQGSLDWVGAALAASGLAALAFAFIESSELGWRDPLVSLFAVGGLFVLGLFLRVEARGSAPMVPLALFRSSSFSGINLLTFMLYGALSGGFFLLPFDLIRAQSYTAAQAGAALLPIPLVMVSLSRWSGGLLDRFGARLPLTIGPLITAAGFVLFALNGLDGSYWIVVFPPMLLIGLGMTVAVAPLTAAVMSAVPAHQIGVASGVNNAVADIASLLAVAAFGALGLGIFSYVLDSHLATLGTDPELAQAVTVIKKTLAGSDVPTYLPVDLQTALQGSISTSFAASFRFLMLGAAGLAALSAVSTVLTVPSKGHA